MSYKKLYNLLVDRIKVIASAPTGGCCCLVHPNGQAEALVSTRMVCEAAGGTFIDNSDCSEYIGGDPCNLSPSRSYIIRGSNNEGVVISGTDGAFDKIAALGRDFLPCDSLVSPNEIPCCEKQGTDSNCARFRVRIRGSLPRGASNGVYRCVSRLIPSPPPHPANRRSSRVMICRYRPDLEVEEGP